MCYHLPMILGRVLLGVLCGLGLIASTGLADEGAPGRIGRLSAVTDGVQYHSPTGTWSSALVNEPVGTGVGVRNARSAASEIRIGDSLLALDSATELSFLQLDTEATQIGFSQGRMYLHLASGNLS